MAGSSPAMTLKKISSGADLIRASFQVSKIPLDYIPTLGHIFLTLFREGGVVRMSPENVERGRRLRPCEQDARGGLGEAVGCASKRNQCALKRRRSARGSRKLVKLLFPHLLVRAAALRTSFNRRLNKSRPPVSSCGDVKEESSRP